MVEESEGMRHPEAVTFPEHAARQAQLAAAACGLAFARPRIDEVVSAGVLE